MNGRPSRPPSPRPPFETRHNSSCHGDATIENNIVETNIFKTNSRTCRPLIWILILTSASVLITTQRLASPVATEEPVAKSATIATAARSAQLHAQPTLRSEPADTWLQSLGLPLKTLAQTGWQVLVDANNDLPHVLQGPGIAVESLPVTAGAAPAVRSAPGWSRRQLEPRLRSFLERVPGLEPWAGSNLRWNERRSMPINSADSWLVEFEQFHDGVKVARAKAVFRITRGRIIQFGTDRLAPVRRSIEPRLSWPTVKRRIAAELGRSTRDLPTTAALVLYPVLPSPSAGGGYQHALLWQLTYTASENGMTYRVLADSDDGAVVEHRATTLQGEVWADVHPRAEWPPQPAPLSWIEVQNSGTKYTDSAGWFDDDPGKSSAQLAGPLIEVRDDCGDIQLLSFDGQLDFGSTAGTDCETTGLGGAGNTQAARDAYYHLERGAEDLLQHQPLAVSLFPLIALTNDPELTCNATWNGAAGELNFGRSGQGCTNAGEVPGMLFHELGHALDDHLGGFPLFGASAEAVADVVALLQTRDGCVARGLRPGSVCHNCSISCSGARDLDRFSGALGAPALPASLLDPGEVDCQRLGCPFSEDISRTGPLGYQAHCESYLASTAIRDLVALLAETSGPDQAWERMQQLWYDAMPALGDPYRLVPQAQQCSGSVDAVDGCAIDSWYHVLLAVDDDDGDLSNGTPNSCRIWRAFAQHGIACGEPRPCSCDRGAPTADAGPDRLLCAGDSVLLGTPGIEGTTYRWQPTGETTAQILVSPQHTTTYRLTATNLCGSMVDEATVGVRTCALDGDFDAGGSGWHRSGQWHAVSSPLCVPPHPSSPAAMYFGQTPSCTFDTGNTAIGDLISPPIELDESPGAVEFSYVLGLLDDRPSRDRAELAISVDGGSWQPRWAANSESEPLSGWQDSPTLALAPYAGRSIRLRFRFDSVDAKQNVALGWWVDHVRLTPAVPPPGNRAPVLSLIESPPESQSECACISCLYTADDAEDGDLSHLLSWRSSRDGHLGMGNSLRTVLSPGEHVLTVSVTDYAGATTTDTLRLEVVGDFANCQLDDWPPAEPRLYCGDDEDDEEP